jgi:hypothetical protein
LKVIKKRNLKAARGAAHPTQKRNETDSRKIEI